MSEELLENAMDGTPEDVQKASNKITEEQKKLLADVTEKYPGIVDFLKGNTLNNVASNENFYNFFGKRISSSSIIMIICYIIAFVITAMIVFQGFCSYFRYHDESIIMTEFWNWVWRKDPLNLPLDPLIFGLQAINLVFAGVEIGTNFITNKDNRKGEITLMPKAQRARILYLVFMWLAMTIIITASKIFLGTRGVDYHEMHIYSGLATALGLFASAERVAKAANKLSGNKDKIDELKEFNKAKEGETNG